MLRPHPSKVSLFSLNFNLLRSFLCFIILHFCSSFCLQCPFLSQCLTYTMQPTTAVLSSFFYRKVKYTPIQYIPVQFSSVKHVQFSFVLLMGLWICVQCMFTAGCLILSVRGKGFLRHVQYIPLQTK